MTRTMTANIPGARLRDVERRLAMLRGEEAINSFLAEHPNEVKVLEQMVEHRRAGKSVPSLTRVQRVMLWSDGEIEYKMEAAPEGRPGESGDRGDRRGGPRSGARGPVGAGRPGDRAGSVTQGGGAGRPGGGAGASRSPGGSPGQNRGPRPGGGGGFSSGGFAGGQSRGPRPGGRPGGGPGRGRGRSFEERGDRGMPRSGEGWVLLREGEKPPEPEPLPEYDWEEEDTPATAESKAPDAEATGASQAEPNA